MVYDGTTYYYVLNQQGDVIQLVNESGSTVASYTYNAWGEILSVSGDAIADINPIRYRGYYYDAETGFYYLQSRYYDPVLCRFINADSQLDSDSFLGYNLFAYCGNNPVNNTDPDGHGFWKAIKKAAAKVKKAVTKIVKAVKSFFGVKVYLTNKSIEARYPFTSVIPSPVTITKGSRATQTVMSYGGSNAYLYIDYDIGNPITSSGGFKIDTSKLVLDVSVGLDNMGISGSLVNGNVTNGLGVRTNISEWELGLENSCVVQWDDINASVDYTNFSFNFWLPVWVGILAETGQSVPSPMYAY